MNVIHKVSNHHFHHGLINLISFQQWVLISDNDLLRPKENNHIRIHILSLSHLQKQQEIIMMSSSTRQEAQQKDIIAQTETFAWKTISSFFNV